MEEIKVSKGNECPSCAGELFFDVVVGAIKCSHCDYEKIDEEYNEKRQSFDSKLISEEPEFTTNSKLVCENCAAEIVLDDELQTVTVCPYCESTHTNVHNNNRTVKPTGIVPFVVDETTAKKEFKTWIKKLRKCKRSFKKYVEKSKINLVKTYRPFWIYNATLDINYLINIQKMIPSTNGFPRIINDSVSGNLKSSFQDVAIDGTCMHYDENIVDPDRSDFENYELSHMVKFDSNYLTGTKSQVYTIDLDDAYRYTKPYVGLLTIQEMFPRIAAAGKMELKHFDTVSSDTTYVHALLPVWEARIVFEDEEYTFSLNGQTAMIFGEYPKSMFFR